MHLVPMPNSYTFDRLAERTSTRRLTAFIKADIRRRLLWREQEEKFHTRPDTRPAAAT